MQTHKKTLVLGFDGIPWSFLEPLLQAGQTPTMQRLLAEGSHGTLAAPLPAWTPVAWASICTGKGPDKHGVFGLRWRKPDTPDLWPTTSDDRLGTPFWSYLNAAGVRVGLVNVPFTYPVTPIDGFMVAGFGTPAQADLFATPDDALQTIRTHYPNYRPMIDYSQGAPESTESMWQAEITLQREQVDVALMLAEQHDVDLLAINLMLFDHTDHFAQDIEWVEKAIRQTDADIARLIAGFEPENVMVVADHGARRISGEYLLYNWLLDHGYIAHKPRSADERSAALNHVLHGWLNSRGYTGGRETMRRAVLRRALMQLPDSVVGGVWRQLEAAYPSVRQYVAYSDALDAEESLLLPQSMHYGMLHYNTTRIGGVSAETRDAILHALKQHAADLRDPVSGAPIIEHVYSYAELYDAPKMPHAPDIILDCYTTQWGVRTAYRALAPASAHGRYFSEELDEIFALHSRDGLFVFAGVDFASSQLPKAYNVWDVTATLLNLYDIPIPDDFDSKAMRDTLRPQFAKATPLRAQPGDEVMAPAYNRSYSTTDQNELLAQMRALGYVE